MDLGSLQNTKGAKRSRMRLGRGMGSGKGKTSGKGHKGQMARKGHKRKEGFEGGQIPLIRRLPKRGFKNPCRIEYAPVNVGRLETFENGACVALEQLQKAGLVGKPLDGIKILGKGELTKSLTVRARAFSAAARVKIEAVGGTCEVM